MNVDPRRVHRAPARGRVELVARRGAPLGPGPLVPPEREDHVVVPDARRGLRDRLQRGRERRHAGARGQVDAREGEPDLEQVDVRVDEPGRDERAVELDHAVGAGGEPVGRVVGADPGDDAVVDEECFCERVGLGVDHAAAVQG